MATKPTTPATAPKESHLIPETEGQLPLLRSNFILMGIAGVMIVLGFCLMLGAPSTADAFNPDIFSTRRIVIGPTVAFLGFIFMGVGIIWHGKKGSGRSKD